MKQKQNYLILVIVISAAVMAAAFLLSGKKDTRYDAFASCIADSQARMYGTWWCPHCKEQKEDFGASWDILKEAGGYVECSTSDQNVQTQVCRDAGITSYPTWRFADGSEMKGRQTFFTLGNKTGCLEDLQPLQSN